MDPIDRLVEEYSEYLAAHGLPSMSADELLVDLTVRGNRRHHTFLRQHKAFLTDFIARWEDVCAEERRVYHAPDFWGDDAVMTLGEWRDTIPADEAAAMHTAFGGWYRDAKEAYEDHEDEVYISWPEYREELFNELIEVPDAF